MGTISINGNSFEGNSISVINGKVIVDGRDVTPESVTITIEVQGNVDQLNIGACKSIKIDGGCNDIRSGSGNVVCGDVSGSVQSGSGDIQCRHVNGNVTTGSGDVECGNVGGNVSSISGDIEHGN